jgi:hypothetical protein
METINTKVLLGLPWIDATPGRNRVLSSVQAK